MRTPKTLQQAIQHFSDEKNCRDFMISMRWADDKVRCPRCGSENVSWLEKAKLYFCPVTRADVCVPLRNS
ncbi:MAG: transposase [Terracidiphilus sp.]